MQLAQVQALRAHIITRAFKATSAQALTPIGLELDKKADQTAARLCFELLYYMLTQNWSVHLRRIFALLEIHGKCYTKHFGTNIHELEKKPVYNIASW